MPAAPDKLDKLHSMLAQVMLSELEWYMSQEEQIPVPAADKAAIIKFLKDNNVTASPMDDQEIAALRAKLEASRQQTGKTTMQVALEAAAKDTEEITSLYNLQ